MSITALNPLNVVSFITDLWKGHQDRKTQKEIAQAKIKEATIQGQTQLELTTAQWEALAVAQTENTWKDEYVTIIVTSPIALLLLGGIVGAFTGDMRLIEGVTGGVIAIEQTGVDMGDMITAVVFAAIGLRVIRGR